MKIESPRYLQTSLAGAIALGLAPGRFYRNAKPGTLNLLLTYPDGCRANCAYCGLARERAELSDDTFIRVKWPVYETDRIIDILKQQSKLPAAQQFGRVCISMITHPKAVEDCLTVVKELRRVVSLPISILTSPTLIVNPELFFVEAKLAGVDWAGVAIDAATPELFVRWRGRGVRGPHQWEKYWQAVDNAVEVFGRGNISVHLIAGLGETEEEMVNAISMATKHGGKAHLFSFCPEPGTIMEKAVPPPLGQYRRIQLAAYLLNNGLITIEQFRFNSYGQLISFGKPILEILGAGMAGGTPFMTSGCPNSVGNVACNRPYGNERPGPVLRNYPFIPDAADMETIKLQIWDGIGEEVHEYWQVCACCPAK